MSDNELKEDAPIPELGSPELALEDEAAKEPEEKPAKKTRKKRLNRDKPYAEIHGPVAAKYLQGGTYFNAAGEACEAP